MLELRRDLRLQLDKSGAAQVHFKGECATRPVLSCVHILRTRLADVMIFTVVPRGNVLQTRALIPPLTLHSPDGRTVRAWDFKQKKNLVIAFLDVYCVPCEEFLHRLAGQAENLCEKEALALVAFLETPAPAVCDFMGKAIVMGAEVSGRSARAFLGEEALCVSGLARRGVFVTDRYGELFAQWVFSGHEFPSVGQILSSLDQVEILCEECGAPHWPYEG